MNSVAWCQYKAHVPTASLEPVARVERSETWGSRAIPAFASLKPGYDLVSISRAA